MSDEGPDDAEEIGETADLLEETAGGFGGGGIADRTTETTETSGTTEATEATGTSGTTETTSPEPGDPGFSLKDDWNGRTIYLSDEVLAEVDRLYKELDLEWSEERGEDLPKNERFYPAIFRAALQDPDSVSEELGLE